ncbi:MAG: hypothetical protein C0506_00805 [Anaerolinea sp.]|nr:hypothetical protein [Anaerolinea sp.]
MLLAAIIAAYITAARLLVGSEAPTSPLEADHRDTIYFSIHGGVLLFALVAGFILGKWLNGLGVAFGLLFFVVIATAMAVAQIAAYQAACMGQNDIIRHWTC